MDYLYVLCLCVVLLNLTCFNGISAQELKCGHPAVPVNARVSLPAVPVNARVSLPVVPGELTSGTVATYTCDPGYELFGSATVTCSTLGVWQGDLPFCGTNIAFRKPANQSTSVRGGAAGNANDGQRTTVHDGRQCTETLKETSPWWRVDLLKPYPIRVVRVTTRGCCGHQPLQDLEVRVGNSSSDLQKNPLCAWYPGTIEEGVTKTFTCARTLIGQHVFLQLVGVEGSLSLCEVEVYTTEEFSNERCVPKGAAAEVEVSAFDRTCYEFAISKGGSFQEARTHCKNHGGDLVHGLSLPATAFLLAELEQRKPKLKTQLVWMGAQKEPGFTSRTWRWVNGDVISRPAWGKDQPNNYNGEQNCMVLDGGRNWLWNDVGCNLDYLHWVCQHASASCGSPDKLVNTTILSTNHSEGAKITYQCPVGHMLVGNANRTCHEGFWTGIAPSCKYVDCGTEAGGLEHGTVVLQDKRTTHGASAVFSCHENYTLIGHEKRKCGDEGKWSGDLPQCLFDWCGEPPAVTGGSVVTSGRRSGGTATYTCQAGYLLSGTGVLSCGLGGAWSGKAPQCRYVDCGSPASTDHGRYNLLNASTTHGSIAKYSCEADYWLDGEEKLTCTREGKWSADTPNCVLITCEEPDVPAGSYVVGYDFNVHSSIEYNCEAGHTLRGQSTLQCTPQGEWSGEAPVCQFVDCGKMPPMLYGTVNYSNNTTYLGSEVTYSCSRNYRLIGVALRKCLENNQWSGESPRCEEIRCPEPKLAEHSILSVTGNDRVYGRTLIRTADSAVSVATYKIGSLLKYRCERGYKVMGDPLSTCQDNGYWSGLVPECVFVDCGEPAAIANGQYSLASNATYYGVAVLYECSPNYQLDGHGRRLCMDNGTWSSDTPTCREIQCGEPESVGSMIVQVMTRSIGGIAHYSCPRGTNMEGNATRTCNKSGAWSGKMPFCKLVDCGQPGPIENGRVIVMNGTTYNSAAEYHCVQHFERIGPYLRKCMDTADWSGEEPRCEVGTGEVNEPQNMGMTIGIAAGVVLFLLIVLGLIYLRLRKATPVKNTENVQAAVRKEEQTAAVTSYAAFNEGNPYGMPAPNPSNIYENIHDQENMYDAPYEETAHYEPSPKSNQPRSNVTINGIAIR